MKQPIFILGFLTFSLLSYAQHELASGLYTVDKQVNLQLKKFVLVDSGRLKNSMKIRVPWNEGAIFNQSSDCYTKSYLRNDTIYVIGHIMGELGYGFGLTLFRDSCIVYPFGFSDGNIYKYHKADTAYIDFIPLPSQSQKVILLKAPAFREGEIIEGFVKLDSYPFYYNGFESEFKIELEAYFKTASIRKGE